LKKSQEDSQKLEAQAKQSTDLLANVKSLQSRLDQLQRDRDDAMQGRAAEAKQRQDAENKATQLETRLNALTKELDVARAAAAVPRVVETRINSKDGLTYVWIPPGKFTMGCSPGPDLSGYSRCFDGESPPHEVTITKGFWMGQTEVTQEAYQRVIGSNPSLRKGLQLPVESATWSQAQAYCEAVGMRLPTEAEWEFAACAGSTAVSYGDPDTIAWYSRNSGNRTHEVGQKRPNAFGLYDMLGNVWEFVADWFDKTYYTQSPTTDPPGPANGQLRVVRGAAYYSSYEFIHASVRLGQPSNFNTGFRCAGELR